jgi:hypothetical protein
MKWYMDVVKNCLYSIERISTSGIGQEKTGFLKPKEKWEEIPEYGKDWLLT